MYTAEYSGVLFAVSTTEELPPEGVLTGRFGSIQYYSCLDGYGVRQTELPGSGFYGAPCRLNRSVPGSINGMPVTELRQTVLWESINNELPVVIEAPNIKRVYLEVRKRTFADDRSKNEDERFVSFLSMMMQVRTDLPSNAEKMELALVICGKMPDEIVISCDQKLILHAPKARKVSVNAPCVVLDGSFDPEVKSIRFSGEVYPNVTYYYHDEIVSSGCFSRLPKLRMLQGHLRGDHFWTFSQNESLIAVHLSNGPKKMPAYAFQNCKSLEDMYVPDTVTELGAYAMDGCGKLRSIHLPPNIQEIPEGMFRGCSSLKKCFLSDDIKTIAKEAFLGCEMLANPWMPRNLTSIGARAFYGCKQVTMITIPDSVKEIGEDAFGDCPHLTIKGRRGSIAQQYALRNNLPFLFV